jgi:hypothetical protein
VKKKSFKSHGNQKNKSHEVILDFIFGIALGECETQI